MITLISLLYGLISIAIVVGFFLLVSNLISVKNILIEMKKDSAIKDIRNVMFNKDKSFHESEYNKHLFFGDHEKARDHLKEIFMYEVGNIGIFRVSKEIKEDKYTALKNKYRDQFNAVSLQFPVWTDQYN